MANSTITTNDRRIIRLPEVERRTGFKRSHIYNLMKEGRFPKSIRIGCRAIGWDSHAIDQWVAGKISSPQESLQENQSNAA